MQLLAFSGWNNGPETTIEYWDESSMNWRELKPVQFPEILQYYGVVVLEEVSHSNLRIHYIYSPCCRRFT